MLFQLLVHDSKLWHNPKSGRTVRPSRDDLSLWVDNNRCVLPAQHKLPAILVDLAGDARRVVPCIKNGLGRNADAVSGDNSIFDQGGFRKAFARAENVDNLHFTRSIDAMDADRVLVHCVKADRRRALAEQAVVRRSPLKGRHQTHAKLKSILTFAFSAPLR